MIKGWMCYYNGKKIFISVKMLVELVWITGEYELFKEEEK